jgi:predicted O-methyltransferase YrrM
MEIMKLAHVRVTPEIDDYLERLIPARDPALARLESEVAREQIPAVGPQVGQLFRLLLRLGRCQDVLELGTAAGYSAVWLAQGCSGRVITVERDPDRAQKARRNLAKAGLADRVEVVEQEAVAFLEGFDSQVDCIFNDLFVSFNDMETVERCFTLSLEHLRPGGLLLADNALRRGEVVDLTTVQGRNVDRYNQLVAEEPELEGLVVPLRDGVSVARRRSLSD